MSLGSLKYCKTRQFWYPSHYCEKICEFVTHKCTIKIAENPSHVKMSRYIEHSPMQDHGVLVSIRGGGGMGDISPQYFRWGVACIIIPPPHTHG